MGNNITIKHFAEFNKAELYAIFRHIYITSDFMSDDFDQKFPTVPDFDHYYTKILRQSGSFLLVAIANNRPVGYLVLAANPAERLKHTANLTMGLFEQFRRKGIGQVLMEVALQRVEKEKIIEIIYLMVRADHLGAVRLYQKAGFEILVRLENDTKIGNEYFDGLLMRKCVGA